MLSDWIIAIPVIRVTAIPVISYATVTGPVSTQTDKDVFAVIIGIDISERKRRTATVVYWEMIPRPYYPMAQSLVTVPVYMSVSMLIRTFDNIASLLVLYS